mgnify:FL=1
MKFHYYSETDSLYIELTDCSSVDSHEASPGVVLDYDSDGGLVGIDIDNASTITDVSDIEDTKDGKISSQNKSKVLEAPEEVPHLASRLIRLLFRRPTPR